MFKFPEIQKTPWYHAIVRPGDCMFVPAGNLTVCLCRNKDCITIVHIVYAVFKTFLHKYIEENLQLTQNVESVLSKLET